MKKLFKSLFQYPVFCLLLDLLVIIMVDIGALLWLFNLVRSTKIFTYALMMLFITAFIMLLFAYYFGIRAVEILKNNKKAVRYLRITSVVCVFISLYFFIQCFIQVKEGHNNQSEYAYLYCCISNKLFDKRHDVALEAIDEAIRNDNNNGVKYHIERANLYLEIYEDLIEESESEVIHDTRQAYNMSETDCLKYAIADYTVALMENPQDAELIYKRGRIYRLLGEEHLEKAIEDLKSAYEIQPNNPDYLLEYGAALIEWNKGESQDEGLVYLEKAVEIEVGNSNPEEYYKYILKALQGIDSNGIRLNGIESYMPRKSFYSELEDRKHIVYGLKKSLRLVEFFNTHKELMEEILTGLKEYVDRDDAELNVIYDYCSLLQADENYDKTLYYLNRIIGKAPRYFRAYEKRWYIYTCMEKYDEAIKDIEKLIEIDNSSKNHIYRANTLYRARRFEEAIEEYKYDADNFSNKRAYCYYSIGQSYYRLGKHEKAKDYFKMAIERGLNDDDTPNCYREWGDVTYILAGNERDNGFEEDALLLFKEAAGYYNSAVKLSDENKEKAFYSFWAGNTYVNLNDYKKAVKYFKMASELNPEDSEYIDSLKTYEAYVQ